MNGNLKQEHLKSSQRLALHVAAALPHFKEGQPLERFQEKCETAFRPELRNFKELDHFTVSMK
ncbi:hypothetical protein AC244_33040 [Ensifer adhaerens]|uniref:Uncharacterized protein n=1 Tax=Ensifer adhaerens TaxID=106592 RepID=A0A0L8BE07_ENSAD|nr:hypothetical protein AC244_33040 [Ensifer adhaerens]